jgi:iron complex outermembrane receptor protein
MLRGCGCARRSLAWLVALLSLCEVRSAAAQGNVMTGTVVSRQDGQPVANAAVVVEGTSLTAVTNAAGRFRIENAPAVRSTVVVKAPGFLDGRVTDVLAGSGQAALIVELDPTPNFLERVQVTATKTPLSVGDVAAQTDIVTRETLDLANEQRLAQAVSHVPGAVVTTQLGIFESVLFRGMPRADLEYTNTLLMIDGVPQTLSYNGARTVALPIYDANSIEIVRGPNSAVYGRTAIGGSINMLTADPTPKPEFGFDFTGGELGTVKGTVKASGPLKDWGGYYVSVGAERNGGYFVDLTTDDYSNNVKSAFGKVTFAPGQKTHGKIGFNYVDSKNFTPTNEPIVNDQYLHILDPRFDRFTNFNIPGPNYNQHEARFTVNLTHEFTPAIRLVETFGYRDVQLKFIDDGDFIGSPYDLEANTVTMYPFSQTQDEGIAYEELRLEWAPKLRRFKNLATFGGSYEHNTGSLFSDFIFTDEDLFGFPNINYLNPVIPPQSEWQHDPGNREYHLGYTGIFGNYMIEPLPRLLLAAGGRYDRLAIDNSRNGGAIIEDTFDAFSPKVSATVRLAGIEGDSKPTVNVYGAYSQAFLPPRRPSSLIPADVPLQLTPETFDNYEVGLKASAAGGRALFEATYFRMFEDGVVIDKRQGPFFIPLNAGSVAYKGFETGIKFAATQNLSVYLNAAFYRNRFDDYVIEGEDEDIVLNGNRLPISPDYVVNWGASWNPAQSINATLNVKHVSSVVTTESNSFELDPYSIVDAAVTWRRGPLRVTLSGHNLFDSEYYWNGGSETVDPGRPRQVLVSFSVLAR